MNQLYPEDILLTSPKTIVIHQPDFIPYLGFFDRLHHCDLFIVLDHVQLLVKGWHNRDKIKGPNGAHWLTVPIQRLTKKQPINGALIDYSQQWQKKHLQTINHFYNKAPYFKSIFPTVEKLYTKNHAKLVDFNMALLHFFIDFFNIEVDMVFSSTLAVSSKKTPLILDLIQHCNGKRYISGEGAKDYLDTKLFEQAEIELIWQNFNQSSYPQLHGEFIPYLSSLDFAMNCGPNLKQNLTKG